MFNLSVWSLLCQMMMHLTGVSVFKDMAGNCNTQQLDVRQGVDSITATRWESQVKSSGILQKHHRVETSQHTFILCYFILFSFHFILSQFIFNVPSCIGLVRLTRRYLMVFVFANLRVTLN